MQGIPFPGGYWNETSFTQCTASHIYQMFPKYLEYFLAPETIVIGRVMNDSRKVILGEFVPYPIAVVEQNNDMLLPSLWFEL